jgi:POT family proton-dependent oligopeptide transporter
MEYAHSQAPHDAKALVQALGLLVAAFASGVAMSLSTVAHDPNLVVFYGSLAATMAATTTAFWFVFRARGNDADARIGDGDSDSAIGAK